MDHAPGEGGVSWTEPQPSVLHVENEGGLVLMWSDETEPAAFKAILSPDQARHIASALLNCAHAIEAKEG